MRRGDPDPRRGVHQFPAGRSRQVAQRAVKYGDRAVPGAQAEGRGNG